MEWDKINRRRSIRVKMPFTIHIYFGRKDPISTYTEDISREGVKIVNKQKINTGSEVKVEIFTSEVPVVCRGKVVWCRKKKSKCFKNTFVYEMGLELSEVNSKDRLVLEKCLKQKESKCTKQ